MGIAAIRTCVALALAAFVPLAAEAAVVDRVAAVVDDEVIALSEIYELGEGYIDAKCGEAPSTGAQAQCRTETELEVLDALIQRVLIRHELQRLDLEVSGEDLERAIDGTMREYGMMDREQLRSELAAQGIGWELYREQLTEQLRTMKFTENVLRPRVTVTDNEIVDLYQRTAREYAGPSEVELEAFSVAVLPTWTPEEKAAAAAKLQAIVAELNTGQRDWLATVKELDAGPYAARDGKMGTFSKGELAPALDAVVFEAKPGDVGGPIDLGAQLLVLKVVEVRSSGVRPLEEVQDQLREQLLQSKIEEEAEQWYQQARRQASVKVLIGTAASAE